MDWQASSSTDKRNRKFKENERLFSRSSITSMAAVTGGVVDQDNSTSKRQSHKITVREGYVSVVYDLHGRRHGGRRGPGQQHK